MRIEALGQRQLRSAHGLGEEARAALRRSEHRLEASRAVSYEAMVLETRLLKAEIERTSQAAARLERDQLALGLRLWPRVGHR
jgi:hypothetical protein